jgi:hypothetical protein
MENQREASPLFWLFVVLVGGAGCGFASDPPVSQPVATLALSAAQSSGNEESAWATVAVSSETSIAVGLGRQDCRTRNVRYLSFAGKVERFACSHRRHDSTPASQFTPPTRAGSSPVRAGSQRSCILQSYLRRASFRNTYLTFRHPEKQ